MNKICSQCKIEKDISEFGFKDKFIGKMQSACKVCSRENNKSHYRRNVSYYENRNVNRKLEIRNYINNIKEHSSCSKCGETHPGCLDFHHLGDKKINIAQLATNKLSNETIDNEISKCIILCANCHRKLHYDNKLLSRILAITSVFETDE